MNHFDRTLDDCLTQMANGAATLDECLKRHPEDAARLKPLLQTASMLGSMQSGIQPTTAFKALARANLTLYMKSHPRSRVRLVPSSGQAWRAAVSLAGLVMAFFITGTAFAQNSLPGQNLYSWKLTSEQVWRAVAPDPVAVDLTLANRRVDELTAIASDPARKAEALHGYQEVLARLKSEKNDKNSQEIIPELKSHHDKLSAAGVSVPDLDNLLAPPDPNPAPKKP